MKVSIVIINYNDKVRIERAIKSALNQTYKDKEVIVVDDGSTEDVREIYKQFSTINLVQLERTDKGERNPSRPRNKGIEVATGDYICFLDSDNYYNTKFVEELMKPCSDVAYCNWEIIGLEENKINIENIYDKDKSVIENYLFKTCLDHQCLLIKRELIGKYDERFPRSQDCEFMVRLMKKTSNWVHVPKTLFYFEKHEKDQQKPVASLYGKTLWMLKHNLSYEWLMHRVTHPLILMSLTKAFNEFMTDDKWKKDRDKSIYKDLDKLFNKRLGGGQNE